MSKANVVVRDQSCKSRSTKSEDKYDCEARIKSGEHEGKLPETVFLQFPDYAYYFLERGMRPLADAFGRLVELFDDKPLIVPCTRCGKPAMRGSAYVENSDLMWWCDDCNPYSTGAPRGNLRMIGDFQSAMDHIDAPVVRGRRVRLGGGSRWEKGKIIRQLACAKGLRTPVTERAALEFFYGEEEEE